MLLHAITAIELSTLFYVGRSVDAHPVKYFFMIFIGFFTLFTQLDARSRYQEFKKVRDKLIRYGPNRRIFKSISGSRCQRDAALAAAKQAGVAKQCTDYFQAAGYRWHHLLPGFVKNHPDYFFSAGFWRTTFFLPVYRPRYLMYAKKKPGIDCKAAYTQWLQRWGTD